MDFSSFVGLPWADRGRDRTGYDCYGLFRAAFFAGTGITLPSYADGYATAADRREVEQLYHGELGDWAEVPVDRQQAFDGVALRIAGGLHIGLIVKPNRLLHVQPHRTSVIERLERYAPVLLGLYRHRELI